MHEQHQYEQTELKGCLATHTSNADSQFQMYKKYG